MDKAGVELLVQDGRSELRMIVDEGVSGVLRERFGKCVMVAIGADPPPLLVRDASATALNAKPVGNADVGSAQSKPLQAALRALREIAHGTQPLAEARDCALFAIDTINAMFR